MKILFVVFALAAVSGCHGRKVLQDEDQTVWNTAVDNVRAFFSGLNSRADRLVQDIQQTQLVRELDTLTQDTMAELVLYRDQLHSNIGPYSQERAEQLARDLQALGERVRDNMADAGDRAADYSQELQSVLQQSASDITTTFNSYARKIRKRVTKDHEHFNKKAAVYIDELQSRTSANAQHIQREMAPYLTQVQDNAQEKFSTINRLLMTQADHVQRSAENFSEQLEKTAEKLRSTLEEKMEEIGEWFTANTAMFRE